MLNENSSTAAFQQGVTLKDFVLELKTINGIDNGKYLYRSTGCFVYRVSLNS